MVVTSAMESDPKFRYMIFVDRTSPIYYVPAKLTEEPRAHHRDLTKWRKDRLLEFGDIVEFEIAEKNGICIVTDFKRVQRAYEEAKHEGGHDLVSLLVLVQKI